MRPKLLATLGLSALALVLILAAMPVALVSAQDEEIDYTIEDDGSIAVAPAETQYGVEGDCVVGMVLVGPENDAGWSQAHADSFTAVAEAAGCQPIVVESINPADAPGTTLMDVATQMVDEGADMIITTSDAFEEDSNGVAEAFPNIPVINMTGSNRLEGDAPDNLANSNGMFEASRFLAGCAAVLKAYNDIQPLEGDEKIRVGFVGPLINFETRRHQSTSYLGARRCAEKLGVDPDTQLEFEVAWLGFWFNIPGVTLDPTEVSNNFFDRGFQVVISGIDTTEPLQVAGMRRAEGEDIWAIGTDNFNACDVAADACIGEQFYDWSGYYTAQIEALQAGTWTAEWSWIAPTWAEFSNTETGSTAVGFDFDTVTEDEQAFLQEVIDELAAEAEANPGSIPGWVGPLNLQDGTELSVEEGPVAPFTVWFLPQLLEGMVGPSTSE